MLVLTKIWQVRFFLLDVPKTTQHGACIMRFCIKTLALAAAFYVPITSLAAEGLWTSNYDAAKKQAAESKKDMLINFTGSDWCVTCIQIEKEIFIHDTFKMAVRDFFIPVEIDFPLKKTKISPAVQKQNSDLYERYGVSSYPTILLTDSEGRPYAATTYMEGGPEKFVAHLNSLRANKAALNHALLAAQNFTGLEKAKALIVALEATGLDLATIAGIYGDITDQIAAADPQDETGFTKKISSTRRYADFKKQLKELERKEDREGVRNLVNNTLTKGGLEKELTQKVMLVGARILIDQKEFDEALKFIEDAERLQVEGSRSKIIEKYRSKIEEGKKSSESKKALLLK